MEHLSGILFGVLLGALTLLVVERLLKSQRRMIYGIALIVIPLIYVYFALRVKGLPPLGFPLIATLFFGGLGVIGWLWWFPLLGLGILLHAGVDLLYIDVLYHEGVPPWYPAACAGYDAVVGLYLLGGTYRRNRKTEELQ